jgi:hypothetical protein
MVREFYENIAYVRDIDGIMMPLPGIRASVFLRDTTTFATIYQRLDGTAQGPSPEAAAVGGPNPFITGFNGSIQFWAENGKYDIKLEDTQAPVRFSTKTLQWDAIPLDDVNAPVTTERLPDNTVATADFASDAVTLNSILDSTIENLLSKWHSISLHTGQVASDWRAILGHRLYASYLGVISGGAPVDGWRPIKINPSDLSVSGLRTRVRIGVGVAANNQFHDFTSFVIGLYRISAIAGAANELTITSDSQPVTSVAFTPPVPTGFVDAYSSEIDCPAAGYYIPGMLAYPQQSHDIGPIIRLDMSTQVTWRL